ncbi:MAG: ABC transporter ATP-binding protein [Chloroflexota bacterium]
MQDTSLKLEQTFHYFATIKPLVRLLWKAGPWLTLCIALLSILQGLLPMGTLYLTALLIDAITQLVGAPESINGVPPSVLALLLGLAGMGVLQQVLGYVQQAIQGLHQTKLANYIQTLVLEKSSSLDLAFFENPVFFNQFQNAIREASYRPVNMIMQFAQMLSSITQISALVTVLLLWQAWIIPILLVTSLLSFRVSFRFSGARYSMETEQAILRRRSMYLTSLLSETAYAKEVRLFGLRHFLLDRFRTVLQRVFHEERRLTMGHIRHSGSVELVLALVQPLLLGFAAIQVLRGLLSIGQFTFYTQSIAQFGGAITTLLLGLAQLHENNLFLTNLFRFLELEPEVEAPRAQSSEHAANISALPEITFRNVSFVYPGTTKPILDNVSFVIRPGESVALVGENGAGKTTLVKLLTGLYRPTSGQILFDGVDIDLLDRKVLRDYLSVVFQDFITYAFSAHDNIALGQIDTIEDQDRVREAARMSGFDKVVDQLPEQYDTVIARFLDTGTELSGGQRQLVSLARALLRRSAILVLDEPSSALDVYKEKEFFERLLDDRSYQQTVIFISHRFSTVRRADRILVLEQHTLLEEGTHDELMQRQGRYAEMFTTQLEMYGESPASHRASHRLQSPELQHT